MTLREAIAERQGEFLYIGSASGYFFIGNDATEDGIQKINDMYRMRMETTVENYSREIKNAPSTLEMHKRKVEEGEKRLEELKKRNPNLMKIREYIRNEKNKTSKAYKTTLEAYKKMKDREKIADLEYSIETHKRLIKEMPAAIEYKKQRVEILTKQLTEEEPMLDRQVINSYEHTVEPIGTVLIVTGEENGDYWFYEETPQAKENKA